MRRHGRSKRMSRHHNRLSKKSSLNLVSLMDIFTILVFFLLVNSSDVEVLESNKDIKLPDSVAEQKPVNTIVVMVNNTDLIVQGKKIANVEDILSSSELEITELSEELAYQASKRPELDEKEQEKGRAVTIMGDKSVPYQLLKRVMSTCSKADYRDISLAVNKLELEEADPSTLQQLQQQAVL